MGHAVFPKHREVGGRQVLLVPEFHRVRRRAGQGGEELVEPVGELLRQGLRLAGDRLELEYEWPDVIREMLQAGLEHRLDEELRVQEIRVELTGVRLVAHLGMGVDGDPVPHLAHAAESCGKRGGVLRQRLLRHRVVEAGVDADGGEERPARVLGEHLSAGAALGILLVIDESLPPRVIPGGSAEVDAGRECCAESLQLLSGWWCPAPSRQVPGAIR